MRASPAILLALAAWSLLGCGADGASRLYLNLAPVGARDPFEDLSSLRVELSDADGETAALAGGLGEEGSGTLGAFHPHGPFRLEVRGLTAAGEESAWGFGPELETGAGPLQASLYFSRLDVAVAHAGPALVDPGTGLVAEGLPWSQRLGPAAVAVAYNRNHLFVETRVAGRPGEAGATFWEGDALVLALDYGSASPASRADDLVLAQGPEEYRVVWNPLGVQPLVDYEELADGYRFFAALPIDPLELNDAPGPSRRLGLGLELREAQAEGAPLTHPWPAAWAPGADYDPAGAGELLLKTRLLDARKVARDSLRPERGLAAFRATGAAPLRVRSAPGEDPAEVFAAWDQAALLLAVASRDGVVCAQEREDGDRAGIQRDDAVELVLVHGTGEELVSRRALFDLSGSTAFDAPGEGAWQPDSVYFRFDVEGERPMNDCREGAGWSFLLRLPWSELGYTEAPPEAGEILAFDLLVYDNDRGARQLLSFSPLGPSQDLEELAELRLFVY